ncbi:hypothetical protein EVAR_28294_1 [Eumeta japonica]|uniref:Uncharacterized protein n=1 Tax=Eumeta variegata TaxID=151549 RepID=A0A4C1V9Z2_EUMVA|nr:hypothetical protein EVAR_28294_1 [Eumeta japonica]
MSAQMKHFILSHLNDDDVAQMLRMTIKFYGLAVINGWPSRIYFGSSFSLPAIVLAATKAARLSRCRFLSAPRTDYEPLSSLPQSKGYRAVRTMRINMDACASLNTPTPTLKAADL